VAEKKVIPILDMVAGEALSTLSGSKQSLALGAMTIRSPFAKVSVLLSSKTEFKFSIQTASTGPSNTSQQYSSGLSCDQIIVPGIINYSVVTCHNNMKLMEFIV